MRASVLVLAALALLALALPAAAVAPHKLARRVAAQPQPSNAATALLEQAAGAASGADAENEIVASLKQLLEQKKASGEAARAKLEAAAAHTLQVEAALAEKQKQLQSHSAVLARLEQCLAQGPAESRFSKLEAQARETQASLLEARSQVDAKDQQLAEAQEELDAQKEALDNQSAELSKKEASLKAAEAHLAEQQSLLEKQALEVSKKEQDVASAVATKVEEGVQAKLAALKAEMEAQAEAKLSAVKSAMQAQAQALLQAAETTRMETKAARISRMHEMHDLTAVDASPYAKASDEALADASEEAEPVLLETSVHEVPVAKEGGIVPAPVSNSTLSRWARKLAAHCAAYDSCGNCGADGRCAWCGTSGSEGRCLPLDVNANLRPGAVSGDGLTSGQCVSDNWQSSVSARLSLLSLNVFASERGNSTRRFAAIVQLIKKTGADVVALQEVEKWFVHALQAHSWVKNNYHYSEYGPGQAPGGLYLLSRYPISSVQYTENIQPGQVEVSSRARVLIAKLGVKKQALYVANTALDYRSEENRAASLEFLFRVLKPYRHVFLMGDFNFDDGSKIETAAIPQSYLDLWPTLIPNKPGFTWDPRSNWFAAASDPQSRASRIDRIYLRSNQWMPRSIHLVGCSVSDPLCGAKNLDVKKGVTLVDSNKVNPALILAAPTNLADRKQVQEAEWGSKIPAFLEEETKLQVSEALEESDALEQQTAFVEMGAEVAAPKPTFEADFVASNHYGLLVQVTQFAPRCPSTEEI